MDAAGDGGEEAAAANHSAARKDFPTEDDGDSASVVGGTRRKLEGEGDGGSSADSAAAATLRSELDRSRRDADLFMSHSRWLEGELRSRHDEVASLRTQLSSARRRSEDLAGRVRLLEGKVSERDVEVAKLTRSLAEAQRGCHENEARAERLEGTVRREVEALAKEHGEAVRQIKSASEERISSLEAELARERELRRRAEGEVEAMRLHRGLGSIAVEPAETETAGGDPKLVSTKFKKRGDGYDSAMTATISFENVESKVDAIALAVDGSTALVSVNHEGRWMPTLCSTRVIPSSVRRYLQFQQKELPTESVNEEVVEIRRDDATAFLIVCTTSPFKYRVIDSEMNASLKAGRIVYFKSREKYFFRYYRLNFAEGKELECKDFFVLKDGNVPTFNCTKDPKRLLQLARIAKTCLASSVLQGVCQVLDKLEQLDGTVEPSLHDIAVQAALGGDVQGLKKIGRFIPCSRQRQIKACAPNVPQNEHTYSWRETPCSCDIKFGEGVQYSKRVRMAILGRRKAHDDKANRRTKRRKRVDNGIDG